MTTDELRAMVAAGLRPVVEFGKRAEDLESYCEPGMRCHVTSVGISQDDCVKVFVDYTAFDEFNARFESHTYYDDNRIPSLTAREAGCYEPTDWLYFGDGDLDGLVKLVDDKQMQLHSEFCATAFSKAGASYVSWLEAEVLRLRSITS